MNATIAKNIILMLDRVKVTSNNDTKAKAQALAALEALIKTDEDKEDKEDK